MGPSLTGTLQDSVLRSNLTLTTCEIHLPSASRQPSDPRARWSGFMTRRPATTRGRQLRNSITPTPRKRHAKPRTWYFI